MGVYLSTPNTELVAEDGQSSKLVFGAASMQGWRMGQEDAHIAIVDYDTDTSLFGVFDGHGGPEVAKYCAQRLPTFIKSLNSYQNNDFNTCLEESFLQFDQTLTKSEVIEELKILSGSKDLEDDNDTDDDLNEAILLREEADLPIGELMARYNNVPIPKPAVESECSSSSSLKPQLPVPSHIRSEMSSTSSKPISPFLRAKRNIVNDSNPQTEEHCSSSSSIKMTDSSSSAQNSSSQPDSTNKMDSEVTDISGKCEDNESKTTNLLNGEINSNNDSTDCEPTSSSISDVSGIYGDNSVSESGSQNNLKEDSVGNEADSGKKETEDTVGQSSDALPYKGKGKHKKVVENQRKVEEIQSDFIEDKPLYELFSGDFDEEEEESDESEDEFAGNDNSSDEDNNEEEEETTSDESDNEDQGIQPPCYERPGFDSGCTAVLALLRGNKLFVANAGDSRCVVSRSGKAIEMSIDHKPEDDAERYRIEKAGGKVTDDGRVNGGLNLSRAIGDHAYKRNNKVSDKQQMITALPDIKELDIEPNDEFMVIACDGIWNSMTSQQVVDFVGDRIKKTAKLSKICDELFRTCLAPNTHGDGTGCDNMSAIICQFITPTPKRKLEDNENGFGSHLATDVKAVVTTDESQTKRVKTTADSVTNDEAVDEMDAKV